jgi:ribosomal-protein-alanine N-acetyltransferase
MEEPVSICKFYRESLPFLAQIQAASPEAAQWNPENYLAYQVLLARVGERVVGFLVARETAPGEREILNLAVDPAWRRKGVAKRLLQEELASVRADRFLEVRESNRAAIALYKSLGFLPQDRREGYYDNPPEAAIVMRFFS